MPLPTHNRGIPPLMLAFAIWGLFPVYWRLLVQIEAFEILLIRLIFTALACLSLLPLRGSWPTFKLAMACPRTRRNCFWASLLLSGNWFSFIWAVNSGNVLQSSLGYFLCPLANIALGGLVEKERLGKVQWISVALAASGVGILILMAGKVPVAAIVIALTWSGYGLIKKRSSLGPIVGLGVETTLLSPIAAGILIWMATRGSLSTTGVDGLTLTYLATAGYLTAVPLLFFAYAMPKVPLSTVGMGQYLVPTMHFALALYYGESISTSLLCSFALIWGGLILYSVSGGPKAIEKPLTESSGNGH